LLDLTKKKLIDALNTSLTFMIIQEKNRLFVTDNL